MDKITQINETELAKYIEIWHSQANTNKVHFWNRNPVAKIIKKIIKSERHWRNKARGNPKKGFSGFLASRENSNFQ